MFCHAYGMKRSTRTTCRVPETVSGEWFEIVMRAAFIVSMSRWISRGAATPARWV